MLQNIGLDYYFLLFFLHSSIFFYYFSFLFLFFYWFLKYTKNTCSTFWSKLFLAVVIAHWKEEGKERWGNIFFYFLFLKVNVMEWALKKQPQNDSVLWSHNIYLMEIKSALSIFYDVWEKLKQKKIEGKHLWNTAVVPSLTLMGSDRMKIANELTNISE